MYNLRQQANSIAAAWAAGKPHHIKITEDRAGCKLRPAYAVFVRIDGQKRGTHVATMLADMP